MGELKGNHRGKMGIAISWKKLVLGGVFSTLLVGLSIFYNKVEEAVKVVREEKKKEREKAQRKEEVSSHHHPVRTIPFSSPPIIPPHHRDNTEKKRKFSPKKKKELRIRLMEMPFIQVGKQNFGLRPDLSLATTPGRDQFGVPFPKVMGRFINYREKSQVPPKLGVHRIVQNPQSGRLGLMTGHIFITFKSLQERQYFLEQVDYPVMHAYKNAPVLVLRPRFIEDVPQIAKDINKLPGVLKSRVDILFSSLQHL